MDYSSVVIAVLIALWGAFEYRNRARRHAALMDALRHGSFPPSREGRPTPLKFLATGMVALLLAGFDAALVERGVNARNGPAREITIMACMIAITLVVLVMILMRDWKEAGRWRP
jgi:hypothetical protein